MSARRRKADARKGDGGRGFSDWAPCRGNGRQNRPWEGKHPIKPWDHAVTAAIPCIDTPELVSLVVELLLLQDVRPFVVIIDTGSTPENMEKLRKLERPGVEIHSLRFEGVMHPSDFPAIAMDFAFARCQTEWLFCTHADCFLKRRDVLSEFIRLAKEHETPAVGYQISERPHEGWEGMVSHTATLLRMDDMLRHGFSWNQRRICLLSGIGKHFPDPSRNNWPDTEIMLNVGMREVGITPFLVDRDDPVEINYRRNEDHRIDHVRSYTSGLLWNFKHRYKMDPILAEAMEAGKARVIKWLRNP